MKAFLSLFFIGSALLSHGQSKSEQIEMLRKQQEIHLGIIEKLNTKVDSLSHELNAVKSENEKLKREIKKHNQEAGTPGNSEIKEKNTGEESPGIEYISGDSDRKIISHPTMPDVQITETITASFKVLVDKNGDVMVVRVDLPNTTTTDQILLNKMMIEIRKELKYTAVKEPKTEYLNYKVVLHPN